MQALQIRVLAIGGIAQTIVGELDDFGNRIHRPAGHGLLPRRICPCGIFIDIVAGVDHEVERAVLRRVSIGVEIAERQIGTANHADIELRRCPFRQGTGPADLGF